MRRASTATSVSSSAALGAFYNTDVEVPATLTVDGRVFRDVGVRFRGNSSFFAVVIDSKSLNHQKPRQHQKAAPPSLTPMNSAPSAAEAIPRLRLGTREGRTRRPCNWS
jgi:hypothetical protein